MNADTDTPTSVDKDISPPPQPKLLVEYRDSKSLLTSFLHTCIRPFRPRLVKLTGNEPPGSLKLTPPKRVQKQCTIRERQVEDVWLYDISCQGTVPEKQVSINSLSEDAPPTPRRRLFYFAGGGWQMPPGGEHWAFVGKLAQRLSSTGLVVTLVSYPMGPHSPAHVALPRLEKMYRTVMEQARRDGEEVIFAGDSSGGNIVLSLVIMAMESMETEGITVLKPDQLMVISPSTDLTHEEPQIWKVAKKDPILTPTFIQSTAKAWSEGKGHRVEDVWQANDPRVSPTFADASLFTKYGIKVNGVTGTWDVLEPEASIYRDKLREIGVEGKWLEWKGQMHCFPLAFGYGLKESKAALEWIINVLKT